MDKKSISKRITYCFMMALVVFTLSSCGKASEKKVNSSEDSKKINIQDTINLSSEDESMDDSQSYFNSTNHGVAKGENGYYFLTDNNQYIMYFDQESRTSIPLCGKADCKHNGATCNAYLQMGKYIMGKIYYYKGYLYLISYGGGNAYLERVNADGSGRQELGEICPYDDEQSGSIALAFHADSVYVLDGFYGELDKEHTNVIRKFSLENKTEETIFEYTGVNVSIQNEKSYGNKLFFLIKAFTYQDGISKPASLGLEVYDYATGITQQVTNEDISDYSVDVKNNIIYYYVAGDGLYKYNLTTKDDSRIFQADEETGKCELSYDGRYIYMNNLNWCLINKSSLFVAEKRIFPKKCLVMDSNGNIVNTINCDKVNEIYFGDEKFLFASNLGTNPMIYMDKTNIENATDWTPLVTQK